MAPVHNPLQFLRSPVRRGLIPSLGTPKPQILWIGCSSSGFPETQTLEVLPEEIIVHRNIGSLVSNNDLNTMSSVEYALRILKVKHIVICGHYGCNFIKVNSNSRNVEPWLKAVGDLYESHKSELNTIERLSDRNRRFAELHALSQVKALLKKKNVLNAVRDRGLEVHAFMYDADKEECVELTDDASREAGNR